MGIEELLSQRWQELARMIDELREDGMGLSFKESTQELSINDNHSGDNATEMFEREKDFGLLGNLRAQRARVEAAQQRLRDGTYGRCARCGRSIPAQRLAALPWAEMCRDCQAASQPEDTARPPVEEEYYRTEGVFGHSFRDGKDEVGYDGEDAWQDVARVGNSNGPQDVPPATRVDRAFVDSDELHGGTEAIEVQLDAQGEFVGQQDTEVDPGS